MTEEYQVSEEQLAQLFVRLSRSKFRSRFALTQKDKNYALEKGSAVLRTHAAEFIRKRLSAAEPENDGKQTPMRGHPVFVAQHATGICCRGCMEKWHGIPQHVPLTEQQQAYLTEVLMAWISSQLQSEVELKYYGGRASV